jgi:hypothetical protein
VLGYTTALASLATEYNLTTALTDLIADGVWIDTPIYRTVASIAANTNRPEKVVIGKLQVAYEQAGTLTVVPQDYLEVSGDIDPATVYSFDIIGPPADEDTAGVIYPISVTAGAAATETTVAAAIVSAIGVAAPPSAPTGPIPDLTVDSTLGVVSWDSDNDGASFYFSGIDERQLVYEDLTPDSGLVNALGTIRAVNDTFYGVYLADCESNPRIDVLATAVEGMEKIMCYTTHDGEVGDNTVSDDIFSTLQTDALLRSTGIYSGDQGKKSGATWMGQMFTKDPGSATWCYKTLPTIAADDLTSNFVSTIEGKGGNWYENIAGINVTQTGQMASGEWTDVIRGRDWLVARLRERLANVMFNADKIPYTDGGAAVIRAEVVAQLNEGIARGYIAADPEPIVTVPKVADVATADKTNRILRDVYFEATLQGAIHKIVVNGVLTS